MTKRVFNFNPGPAVLPLEVLETAQSELLDFKGTGMSVMEISHRSKEFEAVIQTAEADLRELLGIPANYKIMFLQGGASLQFAMLPMNLRAAGASADYIVTGTWSKTAIKEAQKLGAARAAANTEKEGFKCLPASLDLDTNAAYLHFTSNETIHGVEFVSEPTPPAGVPSCRKWLPAQHAARVLDLHRGARLPMGEEARWSRRDSKDQPQESRCDLQRDR